MKDIYVAGAGMTQFGKQLERNVRSLAEEAVSDALADAGVGPEAVEYAFFSNAVGSLITGQACIPGQAALRHTGTAGHTDRQRRERLRVGLDRLLARMQHPGGRGRRGGDRRRRREALPSGQGPQLRRVLLRL